MTRTRHSIARSIAISILGATWLAATAFGQGMTQGIMSPPANMRPPGLKNVGIEQHLNDQIPPDLVFHDETGQSVRLADYFGKKPLILNLVYYQCPMLCGEVLSGLESALRVLKFDVGKEFDVLTVSFDPKETPQMATAKKAEFLKRYGRPGAAEGWHFLTGPESSIATLTKAAGFDYEYDPKTGQFAHATAIMVLTPEGKIAQYYYGVEFAPKDLRLGLVQASQNKIGSIVDEVLLYCYHYNPDTGKYSAIISRILKIAAGTTIFMLGTFLIVMFRLGSASERKQRAV
ncbi:MAG TPA: SCO family protein [Terriglobales bacterium]|jgi:protein SCO1/2|nr:SCO family protein [Terriglobales bacterium]